MLRAASAADLPTLAAIMSDWVAVTPWMPKMHTRDEDLAYLADLHARGTLRLAGAPPHAYLARVGPDVHGLFVAAPSRRRGLGRALIAEAQAAEDWLSLWTFQANAAAREFYAELGFAEVEWGDGAGNDEDLPDVRLEWRRR
jgi:GNAT superfamily N-acetyltransferase